MLTIKCALSWVIFRENNDCSLKSFWPWQIWKKRRYLIEILPLLAQCFRHHRATRNIWEYCVTIWLITNPIFIKKSSMCVITVVFCFFFLFRIVQISFDLYLNGNTISSTCIHHRRLIDMFCMNVVRSIYGSISLNVELIDKWDYAFRFFVIIISIQHHHSSFFICLDYRASKSYVWPVYCYHHFLLRVINGFSFN